MMELETKSKKIVKNSLVLVSGISTSLAILINVKKCFDRTLLASLAHNTCFVIRNWIGRCAMYSILLSGHVVF